MLPDSSVTQVGAQVQSANSGIPTNSREDSIAALIRKSESYAKEIDTLKPPPALPVVSQQIEVKTSEEPVAPQKEVDAHVDAPDPTVSANVATPMATVIQPTPTVVLKQRDPAEVAAVSTDAMEKKLATQIKEYPRDVAGHLEYQLLMFLRDAQVPDMNSLASLPQEDRELISATLDGLVNFRNQLRADNNMLLSKKIRPIVDLSERLQSRAELNVPTLSLCTRVDGYGRYEPIEPPRFVANSGSQAIVYAEVANFTSQFNGEKRQWQTDLTQETVIYAEGGMQVWADQSAKIQDFSRNKRHDFFVRKLITIPQTLPIGRYLLKVTITDQQANRVAEASLPIQVVAQ